MGYSSEAEKVRGLPEVMAYIQGDVLDVACGSGKITPEAIGFDGRDLPGVDLVGELDDIWWLLDRHEKFNQMVGFDTVFSSHFLEHCQDQYGTISTFDKLLKTGGHLVLYLPTSPHYDNRSNPEHMVDMNYEDFLFWFKQSWCGEGKNFKGENFKPCFELVYHALDVEREDCYSFVIVARKV